MKKVIIIGASSFIGVYTVDEFIKQGCEVIVTGRDNKFKEHYDSIGVKYYNVDLRNESDFNNLPNDNITGVILLAGLLPANTEYSETAVDNAKDYIEINTIGTINLLNYCRKNNINRIISTLPRREVINKWEKDKPLTEEIPRDFLMHGDHAAYIISKAAAFDIMEYYNQEYGMKNAAFRFPAVYGVGPHSSYCVNGAWKKSGLQIFIDAAKKGEDIFVYGDLTYARDVAYVKDVAHAFYLAIASKNTYGVYNMTTGIPLSLWDEAKVIADVFAKDEKSKSKVIHKPDIPNNGKSATFSMDKAKRDFAFTPNYSDFKKMMKDYKYELERGYYSSLFKVGK